MKISNLVIIAGSGNKSGKTSMACRIIEKYRDLEIYAIKITPHFHETTPGLELLIEKAGTAVYREKNPSTDKDTSRMLKSGASAVFFAKVTDGRLKEAFLEIMKYIPDGSPVVCESPALRHFIEPGLFVIMRSHLKENQKDINKLAEYQNKGFTLDDISDNKEIPIGFSYGSWFCL